MEDTHGVNLGSNPSPKTNFVLILIIMEDTHGVAYCSL